MENKQSATTELPVGVQRDDDGLDIMAPWLDALTIQGRELLAGADGRHYVVLGEVIDLYVMGSWAAGPQRYTVFAYEDREWFFTGGPQRDHKAACGEFMQHHYGDRLWLFDVERPFTYRVCSDCFIDLLKADHGLEGGVDCDRTVPREQPCSRCRVTIICFTEVGGIFVRAQPKKRLECDRIL